MLQPREDETSSHNAIIKESSMWGKTLLVATITLFLTFPVAEAAARQCPNQNNQTGPIPHASNVIWDVFVNGKCVNCGGPMLNKRLMPELDPSK
jgi:hypothetical protein